VVVEDASGDDALNRDDVREHLSAERHVQPGGRVPERIEIVTQGATRATGTLTWAGVECVER
jgi:hypothetical protein